MSDFIREVDEDYRRERVLAFLTRFQIPLAILVVAIIVGAGVWRYWIDNKTASAEADNMRYAAADQLAKDGKIQPAQQAFAAIAKTGPAGYAMLARMRAAALLAPSDPEGAAKAFDEIANLDTIDGSMRDTARVRGAMLRLDTETPAAFEQRYGRFTSPGFAFHASMNELLALAALKRNDFKAAGTYIDAIIVDPLAPPALRNRAQAFRALVNAGPATPMTSEPPPTRVTPMAAAAAPSPTPAAAAAPSPTTPPVAATPPARSPAAPLLAVPTTTAAPPASQSKPGAAPD